MGKKDFLHVRHDPRMKHKVSTSSEVRPRLLENTEFDEMTSAFNAKTAVSSLIRRYVVSHYPKATP